MANEQERPAKSRGSGKQVAGGILFGIGLVVLVPCLIMIVKSSNLGTEAIGFYIALIVVMIICGFLLVIGVLTVLIGKGQEIEQRNLAKTGDSQSDYNNVD
jgi:uncharacterized membrane protein YedE/YeeE